MYPGPHVRAKRAFSNVTVVEVLGSSTLLLPSSFVYCHIYVVMLCVIVVIKTGMCVEIYFMGPAVHVL